MTSGLEAELARVRRERDTWELAALAGLLRGLDPATAQQVGDRMRVIVFGREQRPD